MSSVKLEMPSISEETSDNVLPQGSKSGSGGVAAADATARGNTAGGAAADTNTITPKSWNTPAKESSRRLPTDASLRTPSKGSVGFGSVSSITSGSSMGLQTDVSNRTRSSSRPTSAMSIGSKSSTTSSTRSSARSSARSKRKSRTGAFMSNYLAVERRLKRIQLVTQKKWQAPSVLVTHKITRLSVMFKSWSLEKEYREYMFPTVLSRGRKFGILAGLVFFVYMIQSTLREDPDSDPKFYYLSIVPCAIIFFGYPILYCGKSYLRQGNNLQWFLSLSALSIALAQVGRGMANPRNIGYVYTMGFNLPLWMGFFAVTLHLRFPFFAFIGCFYCSCYVIGTLVYRGIEDAYAEAGVEALTKCHVEYCTQCEIKTADGDNISYYTAIYVVMVLFVFGVINREMDITSRLNFIQLRSLKKDGVQVKLKMKRFQFESKMLDIAGLIKRVARSGSSGSGRLGRSIRKDGSSCRTPASNMHKSGGILASAAGDSLDRQVSPRRGRTSDVDRLSHPKSTGGSNNILGGDEGKGGNDRVRTGSMPHYEDWWIEFKDLRLKKVRNSKIGAGGSGQVYKGKYMSHPVAIKELYAQLMDPDDINEFRKESSLLFHLRHPHIVEFYGVSPMQ